jgi:hypothetical protein
VCSSTVANELMGKYCLVFVGFLFIVAGLKTREICEESLPDDMEVLSMIEIFSRTIHNRRILCDSRLFPFLKRHIVSLISKFDVLTSVKLDEISDDHPTLKWLEVVYIFILCADLTYTSSTHCAHCPHSLSCLSPSLCRLSSFYQCVPLALDLFRHIDAENGNVSCFNHSKLQQAHDFLEGHSNHILSP